MSDARDACPANRLIGEKSPYLLQHAHNPVDWYPWGEGAFEKARQEDKPIFLSIGYSTCHWCHVMERESFENEAIANLMNDLFVNIKVDREERPDVDRVYMTTVQALTGQGGWPLSVWLTPDLKPFFGGTYFPPQSQYGRPGFPELLRSIGETWKDRRDQVEGSAEKIFETLAKQETALGIQEEYTFSAHENAYRRALDLGFKQFGRSYDVDHAGFSEAPKFPRPSTLNFLLRYWSRTGEREALNMTLETLRRMWAGGIYDHLGGGFHRYSVDAYWRIPHFEKMLYDQAQLVVSYVEAYQITGESFFAEVAKDVLEYVLRDMTDPGGGFYSAEDADSATDASRPDEKEEGAFYMWTREEVEEALGEEDAPIFMDIFGISEVGNSISDPTGELGNRNVLFKALTLSQVGTRSDRSESEIEEIMERGKQKLLAARQARLRPHLDDKIITAWNGLMISAFAKAAGVFSEQRYLEAAARAAGFVETHLYDLQSGRLWRRYREGEAGHPAHLEDYASFVQGLLDLYEASLEGRWLDLAVRLTETQLSLFSDESGGGFFDTAGDDHSIILRTREIHDGAEPSGSSIAACNLLRLAGMLDRSEWRLAAEGTIGAVARILEASPVAMPQMLATLELALQPPRQIVIAGDANAQDTREMVGAVFGRFLPNKVVVLADREAEMWSGEAAEFYGSLQRVDDKATVYVCENYACQLPTNEPTVLAEILDKVSSS